MDELDSTAGLAACMCSSNSLFYSFMGRGIIEKPLKEVAEFIKNVDNNMSWDNFLIVSISSGLEQYHFQELPLAVGGQILQDHFRDALECCVHRLSAVLVLWNMFQFLLGYQRYETKKCMLTTKRDMLYFTRCVYKVSLL